MFTRSRFFSMTMLLGGLVAQFQPTVAAASEPHHFKAVSFQAREGATPAYSPAFDGDIVQLIEANDKNSEAYVTVHTPHIHPGDIVNLQADVLGHGADNGLEDDGMNCQLSYNSENDKDFTIGGMCTFFATGASGTAEKRNVIIPPHGIVVSDEQNGHWVLLFDDKQTGIAFYAGIER